MINNLSDFDVVAQILSGDVAKFSVIVERYQNPLLRYVGFLTNRSSDSEDIVQETFIKVYKNLRKYNPKLKFSSWIYRISHNEAVNYIKKKKPILIAHDEMWKLDNHISAKNHGLSTINKITVQQLLGKLPMKYKELLELYYIEEYSYSEISDILRMPIGTVGVRLKRGISLLRNLQ